MAGNIGAPGAESFRDMIMEFRNRDIFGAMKPLITLRQEVIGDDEFQMRGGTDNPVRAHILEHLLVCDKLRRFITHNPEDQDVGDELARAIDPNADLSINRPQVPFAGEAAQNASKGLAPVPWPFDGSDPDIPMMSSLQMDGIGLLLVGSIDMALVSWTRLESRNRTRKITLRDSYRMYSEYIQMYEYALSFLGDENRVDIAQVLPSKEPRGVTASPNISGETSGAASRAGSR